MTAADYRRWFTEMGAMGVRAVRVYTIHPPAFYDELATYNQAHPEAPLYLVQGVYLPDESYVEPGQHALRPGRRRGVQRGARRRLQGRARRPDPRTRARPRVRHLDDRRLRGG